MPLLKLETTVVLSEDKRQALLASLSKIVAETIGKPQQYVMVPRARPPCRCPAVRVTRPLWMSGALAG
jgi:hypothetical protein